MSESHSLHPGQSVSLSAVVVGQDIGTVQGSVFAQFADEFSNGSTPQLGTGQTIQEASQRHCNKLSYTIFSSSYENLALVLSTSHREQFYYLSSKEVSQAMEQYNKPSDIPYAFFFLEEYWSHTPYGNIVLEIPVTLNLLSFHVLLASCSIQLLKGATAITYCKLCLISHAILRI